MRILLLWYLIWESVTSKHSLLLMNLFLMLIISLVPFLKCPRKIRARALLWVAPSPHLTCSELGVLSLASAYPFPSTPVSSPVLCILGFSSFTSTPCRSRYLLHVSQAVPPLSPDEVSAQAFVISSWTLHWRVICLQASHHEEPMQNAGPSV